MTETATRHYFKDLVDQTGITYRQADYWVREGFIHCPPPGSGNPRYLTNTEATVLRIMAQLVNAGLPPADAAPIARSEAEGHAIIHTIAQGVHLIVTNPDTPDEPAEVPFIDDLDGVNPAWDGSCDNCGGEYGNHQDDLGCHCGDEYDISDPDPYDEPARPIHTIDTGGRT